VAGESLSASSGNYASSEEEEKALWAIWRNKAEPEKGFLYNFFLSFNHFNI